MTTALPIEIAPALIKDLGYGAGKNAQWVYRFANGFGASVIQGPYTYGGEAGLYELAVIAFGPAGDDDFHVIYDTPVTSDVIGWLSVEEVAAKLVEIAALQTKSDAYEVAEARDIAARQRLLDFRQEFGSYLEAVTDADQE